MLPRGGVNQLRGNSYLVVSLPYAAFQDVTHPHLPTHVLHFHRLAFVGEGRITSDDKEAGDSGEVGGEHFGDAVAEVVLLWVFAHVVERQHDDGGLVRQGQRRWRSPRT